MCSWCSCFLVQADEVEEEWLQDKLMDLATSTARAMYVWEPGIVCDAGINVCLCVCVVCIVYV